MKEVHHRALAEIESEFGALGRVDEEKTTLQLGWSVNLGEEEISFNFTRDGVRIFEIKKLSQKSRYKGLEKLRTVIKKAGLEQLVFYQFDTKNLIGEQMVKQQGPVADGLDKIPDYFKVHALSKLDESGGCLHRIGSFRR